MSLRHLPCNTHYNNNTTRKKRKKILYNFLSYTFKVESSESSTHDRVIGSCRLHKNLNDFINSFRKLLTEKYHYKKDGSCIIIPLVMYSHKKTTYIILSRNAYKLAIKPSN